VGRAYLPARAAAGPKISLAIMIQNWELINLNITILPVTIEKMGTYRHMR
jgi:hypothetical protein